MKVAAVVGPSGSGKTTLLSGLIAELVAEGSTVAAIKHTHHPLDPSDRGDTSLLRRAGADPVILAADGEAIRFDGAATSRFPYTVASDLLLTLDTDIVLIEGFSQIFSWPRVELDVTRRVSVTEARRILDRIWQQPPS